MNIRKTIASIIVAVIACCSAAGAATFTVSTSQKGNIVPPGENFLLMLSLYEEGVKSSDVRGDCKFRIEDFFGEVRYEGAGRLEPKNGGMLEISSEKLGLPPGFYRVRAKAKANTGEALNAETTIALLPQRMPQAADNMYGINRGDARTLNLAGIQWSRQDISWPSIEPEKGKFTFDRYDKRVDSLVEGGVKVLGILNYSPRWAARIPEDYAEISSGPHKGWGHFPPRDLDEWGNYVEKTVTHYKGRISHWEIWNEPFPNFIFWNGGTIDDYVALMKTTYARGKAACPECTFIGLGGTNSSHAKMVFAAGGFTHMDAASIHIYQPGIIPEGGIFRAEIKQTFDEMRKYGRVRPLWLTESGWPTHKGLSETWVGISDEDQARYLVRAYLLAQAEGIEKFFWYCFSNGAPDPGNFERYQGILYHDGTPKPAYSAYAAMTAFLGGAEFKSLEENSGPNRYAEYETEGSHVVVLWTTGKTSPFDLSVFRGAGSARFYDMMGTPINPDGGSIMISKSPLYMVYPK